MCFMAWLYELIATLSAVTTPCLQKLGFSHLQFPDAIIMFVIIPFTHLMNDEDTKAIILQKNWYQGLGHMLGLFTTPE